jgi:hypothetical protein
MTMDQAMTSANSLKNFAIAFVLGVGVASIIERQNGTGSVPNANDLKCEMQDTKTDGDGTVKPPETSTWLIRLERDRWFWISLDGMPIAGPKVDQKGFPLRVDAQSYTLFEK